jgi:hypothetical protein
MIARLTWFLLALAPASLSAQNSQAWLHAIDYRHRVLYVTDIENVELADAGDARPYLNGFVKSMHWSAPKGKDHIANFVFANRDYFANFAIISRDAKGASADRARRYWLIAKYRDLGYRIEDVRMPAPIPMRTRTPNSSQVD